MTGLIYGPTDHASGRPTHGSGKKRYPEFARGGFLTVMYQQDENIFFNLSFNQDKEA